MGHEGIVDTSRFLNGDQNTRPTGRDGKQPDGVVEWQNPFEEQPEFQTNSAVNGGAVKISCERRGLLSFTIIRQIFEDEEKEKGVMTDLDALMAVREAAKTCRQLPRELHVNYAEMFELISSAMPEASREVFLQAVDKFMDQEAQPDLHHPDQEKTKFDPPTTITV